MLNPRVIVYKIPNCFCQNITYWFWRILLLQRHVVDEMAKRRDPTLLSTSAGSREVSKVALFTFSYDKTIRLQLFVNKLSHCYTKRVCGHSEIICEELHSQYIWFGFQCFHIYPWQIREICEAPWACDNSSVNTETTGAVASLFSEPVSWQKRLTAWHLSKATQFFGLAHFQPASVTPHMLHDVLRTPTCLSPCLLQAVGL